MKPLFGINNALVEALIGEIPPYCTGVTVEFKPEDFVIVTVTQILPDTVVAKVKHRALRPLEIDPPEDANAPGR